MNIRIELRQATEADFDIYKEYYVAIPYHWYVGNFGVLEREKLLEKEKERVAKPLRVKPDGRVIRSAYQKRLSFSEEDFGRLLSNPRRKVALICNGKDVIGIVNYGPIFDNQMIRIYEMPLEPEFQYAEIIDAVLKQISKKGQKFYLIYSSEFGASIVKDLKASVEIQFIDKSKSDEQ